MKRNDILNHLLESVLRKLDKSENQAPLNCKEAAIKTGIHTEWSGIVILTLGSVQNKTKDYWDTYYLFSFL